MRILVSPYSSPISVQWALHNTANVGGNICVSGLFRFIFFLPTVRFLAIFKNEIMTILIPSTSEGVEWAWRRLSCFSFERSLITNPQCYYYVLKFLKLLKKIKAARFVNRKARFTLFANTTNRRRNHFFAEQLLYTVCCSPSIFTRSYSPLRIFFWRKTPLYSSKRPPPRRKSYEQHTAKNLFAKHGEHLLYTIHCTSFLVISPLFHHCLRIVYSGLKK